MMQERSTNEVKKFDREAERARLSDDGLHIAALSKKYARFACAIHSLGPYSLVICSA